MADKREAYITTNFCLQRIIRKEGGEASDIIMFQEM